MKNKHIIRIIVLVAVVALIAALFAVGKSQGWIVRATSSALTPYVYSGENVVCNPFFNADKLEIGDIVSYRTVISGDSVITLGRVSTIYDNHGEFLFGVTGDNSIFSSEETVIKAEDITGELVVRLIFSEEAFSSLGLALLMILAAAMFAIVPRILICDEAIESYPNMPNGSSPISFCFPAVLLLLLGISDCYDVLTYVTRYYNNLDLFKIALLAEGVLTVFIAILLLCKKYNKSVRFLLIMKILLLVFNNMVLHSGALKDFLLCLVVTIADLIEILAWCSVFQLMLIVLDKDTSSKRILLLRAAPWLMLIRLILGAVGSEPEQLYRAVFEGLCYILLTEWIYSPFKRKSEAYAKLREARSEKKVVTKGSIKFAAITLAVVLAAGTAWAGVGQIPSTSGIDNDQCAVCRGSGLINEGVLSFKTCPTCKGSGMPPH